MYRVRESFIDLQDGKHLYSVGDAFPRQGLKVSESRIVELSGKGNKRGIVLIEEIKDKPKPKAEPEAPKEVKHDRSGHSDNAEIESGKAKRSTRRVSGTTAKRGKK